MKTLKGFLLRTAGSPGSVGFVVGTLAGLVATLAYGAWYGFDVPGEDVYLGMGSAVVLGVFLGFLMMHIKAKYIAHTSDYETEDFWPDYLLRIQRGKVLAVGTALWGRNNIHPISFQGGYDSIYTTVETKTKRGNTKSGWIDFDLRTQMRKNVLIKSHGLPYAFDPQEIYDHVLKDRRNKGSVSKMIAREFEQQVLNSKAIKALTKKYRKESLGVFAKRLTETIKKVPFKLPFSNVRLVTVEVTFEIPELKTSYSQY